MVNRGIKKINVKEIEKNLNPLMIKSTRPMVARLSEPQRVLVDP
jgi:hypothetical protein